MSSARFEFGLERVRELRVHAEDRAKEDLAQSLAARVRGEQQLAAADHRLRSSLAAGRDSAAAPLTGMALLAQQAWTERMERTVADARNDLRRAEADVEARRAALGDAAREREVLERLKAKKLAAHQVVVQRAEDAATDEMASRAFLRARAAA